MSQHEPSSHTHTHSPSSVRRVPLTVGSAIKQQLLQINAELIV